MNNSFRIYVVLFLLFCLSVVSIPGLNISAFPQKATRSFTILFSCAQSSPEQTEQKATALLENFFSQVKNLKEITSVSGHNFGKIDLTFDSSEDIVLKRFELLSMLRQIKPKIPTGVSYPRIISNSESGKQNTPSLVYAISSDLPPKKIKELISKIWIPKLSIIDGVKDVEITGLSGKEINITYNNNILLGINSSREELINSIKSFTKKSVNSQLKVFNLKNVFLSTRTAQMSLDRLRKIPLLGHPNYDIGNIADFSIEEVKPSQYLRINGKKLLLLNIYFSLDVNALRLSDTIKEEMRKLSNLLPIDIKATVRSDDGQFIRHELEKNTKNLIITFLITIILFSSYFYKRLNLYLVFLIRFLLSLFFSLLLIRLFNINLNIYSIQVLNLVFPILTCFTIMSIENNLKRRTGTIPRLLIITFLISCSLFVIFLFTIENHDFAFEFFSLASVCSVAALIVGILLHYTEKISEEKTITLLSPEKNYSFLFQYYVRLISFLSMRKGLLVVVLVLAMGLPTFFIPSSIKGYVLYNETIGTSLYKETIGPVIDKTLGGVSRLFMSTFIKSKAGLFNDSETKLYIKTELPSNSDIEQMNSLMLNLEKFLSSLKGVKMYFTQIVSGQSASIEISFDKRHQSSYLPIRVKNLITAKVLDYGGGKWNIYGVGRGFSNMANQDIPSFSIQLTGYDYEQLERESIKFANYLSANKRVTEIKNNQGFDQFDRSDQIHEIAFNKKLSLVGINKYQIYTTLNNLSDNDAILTDLVIENEILPIRLREKDALKFSSWDLQNNTYLNKSRAFSLRQLGKMTTKESSSTIHKINREYVRVISLNYLGDYQMGMEFLTEQVKGYNDISPIGFAAAIRGYEPRKIGLENYYGFLALICLIALCILTCAIYFDSFRISLILLALLPCIYIGIFYSYYLHDDVEFDLGGIFAFATLTVYCTLFFIYFVDDAIKIKKTSSQYHETNLRIIHLFLGDYRIVVFSLISLLICNLNILIDNSQYFFWTCFFAGIQGGSIMMALAYILFLPIFLFIKNPLVIKKKINIFGQLII